MAPLSIRSVDRILSTTRPFNLASEDERRKLVESTDSRWFRPRQYVFERGAPKRTLHIVVSGLVRVGVVSKDGAELAFHFIGPGRLIGALDALVHAETMSDAMAIEKSQIVSIDAEAVRRFASGNAAAALALLDVVGEFSAEIQRLLEDLAFLDLRARAARRLVAFVGASPTNGVIHISQSDFASAICATRERLNRVLSEWRGLGVVECLRGRIIVHDIKALRHLARAPSDLACENCP